MGVFSLIQEDTELKAILIIVTLIIVAVEVLIGLKRGLLQSAFRVILLTIGTVVDVLISARITQLVMNKVASGLGKASISELVSDSVGSEPVKNVVASSGGVIAGVAASVAAPFIFALLYIIFKALTWVIYLIVAPFLRKGALGDLMTSKAVWSKVGGACLGAFVALYSCALIAMPVTGLLETLKGESVPVESLTKRLAGDSDKIAGFSVDKLSDGMDDVWETMDSAATVLYKVTGAKAVSGAIYNSLSKASPKDAGYDIATEYISFPEWIKEALEMSGDVFSTMDRFNGEIKLDASLVENLEGLFNKVIDTNLLADEDKVAIVNSVVPMLKDVLKNAVSFTDLSGLVKSYDNFADMKAGYGNLFTAAKKLLNVTSKLAGTSLGGSGSDSGKGTTGSTNVMDVISDKENVEAVVESIILVTEATEGDIGQVLTDVVGEYSDVKVTEFVNKDVMENISEKKEEVVDTLVIVGEIVNSKDEKGKTSLTEDEINEKIEQLETLGVVTPEAVEEFRKYVKENGVESIDLEGVDLSDLGI